MELLKRIGSSRESRTATWAILDQCAVSGGNFLTNLILLRRLVPAEFAIYALMLNAIVFFGNAQQALIIFPLCVRGPRARPTQFRNIVGFALFGTTLLVLALLGPTLSLVGFSLRRSQIVIAAVLAMFFWQLQDTVRAAFIARMEQRRALLGDGISYLGQAMLLGWISLRVQPSLNVIFATIAGTSLIALVLQSWQIRPSIPPRRTFRPLIGEFWMLGHWAFIAKILGFLTLQAFPWVILIRHGKLEVAGFQAIFQFLAFSNPLLFSVGSLITATVAKSRDYKTPSVQKYGMLVGGLAGSYLLALAIGGSLLMRLFYGGNSPYLAYAFLMPVFAIAWCFEVIAQMSTAVLGGLRQPRAIFAIQMSGAMAALLIALPLTYWKGLVAVGSGLLLVNVARTAAGVLLLWRHGSTTTGNGRAQALQTVRGDSEKESLESEYATG